MASPACFFLNIVYKIFFNTINYRSNKYKTRVQFGLLRFLCFGLFLRCLRHLSVKIRSLEVLVARAFSFDLRDWLKASHMTTQRVARDKSGFWSGLKSLDIFSSVSLISLVRFATTSTPKLSGALKAREVPPIKQLVRPIRNFISLAP